MCDEENTGELGREISEEGSENRLVRKRIQVSEEENTSEEESEKR